MKVKIVPVYVESHGDLAELVGVKKKAGLKSTMSGEASEAIKEHCKEEMRRVRGLLAKVA